MAVPGHDTRDFGVRHQVPSPSPHRPGCAGPPEGKEVAGLVGHGNRDQFRQPSTLAYGLPDARREKKRKINRHGWNPTNKGNGKKKTKKERPQRSNVNVHTSPPRSTSLAFRPRYWGEPFPSFGKPNKGRWPPVSTKPCPIRLPLLPPPLYYYKPTPDGHPPLARRQKTLNLPDGSTPAKPHYAAHPVVLGGRCSKGRAFFASRRRR